MGLNLDAVGTTSEPFERSWDSKDALLYALGVGAGALDPTGFELEFTTENSEGVTQRVLPTFTTIVGQGGGAGMSLGDYDPAMLVHGEQSIRLHGELPVAGTVTTTTTVAGMYDKGAAGLVVLESASRHAESGEPAFSTRTALFIRGAGGFGGPRNPEGDDESALAAEPLPTCEPDEVVSYSTQARSGAALPFERGPQPLALRPDLRQAGGLRRPDPARPVHVRVHRDVPCCTPSAGRTRRASVPCVPASPSRRCPATRCASHCGTSAIRCPVPTGSAPRRSAARPSSTRGSSRPPAEGAGRDG